MSPPLLDGGSSSKTQNGLCAACCSGTNPLGAPNASYNGGAVNGAYDCAAISCAGNGDCPYPSSACSGGFCQ